MDQLQEIAREEGAAPSRPPLTLTLTSNADVRDAFRQKELEQALYDGSAVMHEILLTLHGDVHRARRRAENTLFSLDAIRDYQRRLIPDTVRATMAPFFATGTADLVRAGHLITMNLVADLTGVDRPLSTHAESDELYACCLELFRGAALIHTTGDKDQVGATAAAAMKRLAEGFISPSIRRRQKAGASAPPDLLSNLLGNMDRLEMSLDDVHREVAFYLEGGSHSTATALTDTLHDIFEWCRTHPEDRPRAQADRNFLQRCVHETLRLHPASPVARRRARRDLVLGNGRRVAGGELVVLDLMAANRDPDVYGADSAVFNPHRRLPPGASPWGTTFGGGIHACIGQIFAAGLPAHTEEGGGGDHLFGAMPLIVHSLLAAGARPDPARPPEPDRDLARPHWGTYWVLFGQPAGALG